MKLSVLLCAVNSKYVHSSLAPWYLKAAVTDSEIFVEVEEATINQPPEEVLRRLTAHHPQVLGFSCYIWNISYVTALLPALRQALPESIILLGGPEVSYRPAQLLLQCPEIDYVLCGEGELPFPMTLDALKRGEPLADAHIPGLCGRDFSSPPHVGADDPPSPYTPAYFQSLQGRIAYLETSRGCPFSCAFCLSGRCGPARFFDLDRAKKDLLALANSGARTVKLVDRTFNANPRRAAALVSFVCGQYGRDIPKSVCFHFELAGDLLTDELITLFRQAPKGLFQVEIGLQSFFLPTLEAVHRKTDLDKVAQSVSALLEPGNLHVHIDLIAGLPLETLATFREGINRAFSLKPHMLQLGFLKLLPGSPMAEHPAGVFSPHPPYEVQETPWLSPAELTELKAVEDALDRLWNSGRFRDSLCFTLTQSRLSPYELLLCFSAFAGAAAGMRLEEYAGLVLRCFSRYTPSEPLRDVMTEEWLAVNSSGRLPPCLWQPGRGALLRLLDDKPETKRKPGIRRAAARLSTGEILFVDYENKDAITGRYTVKRTHSAST